MTHRTRAPASNRKERRRPQQRGRTPPPTRAESPEPKTEGEEGFLFDPYWDEIFDAYYDPTLHTCCRLKY